MIRFLRLLTSMLILTTLVVGREALADHSNHFNRINKDSGLSYQDKLNIEEAEMEKRIDNFARIIPVYESKIKHLCPIEKFAHKCKLVQARLQDAHRMKSLYKISLEKIIIERDLEAMEAEDFATSEQNNYLEDNLEATESGALNPDDGFQS